MLSVPRSCLILFPPCCSARFHRVVQQMPLFQELNGLCPLPSPLSSAPLPCPSLTSPSQFLTADKFVLPVVQTEDLGVLLDCLSHVTSSSIQFCWLSLSTSQTRTASSPSLKHHLSPGLLQSPDRLPASPLALPVQCQHSC